MKFATWNVNSLTVRLPHLEEWVTTVQPDVLCLQETKQEDSKFPHEALKTLGYHTVHSGQKTYNGVAILSRQPLEDISVGIPGFSDEQKRVVAATVGGIRVINVYIPNGQSVGSEKYQYKLNWLASLHNYLQAELQRYPRLMLLGDYNIAPADADVHDPAAWLGQVHVSEPERTALQGLISLGLHDSFRLFEQPEGSYSWWDYRMGAFRRNMGLRIDHILVSTPLLPACKACWIDKAPRKLERPSDHTPVVLELQAA